MISQYKDDWPLFEKCLAYLQYLKSRRYIFRIFLELSVRRWHLKIIRYYRKLKMRTWIKNKNPPVHLMRTVRVKRGKDTILELYKEMQKIGHIKY